MKNKIFSFSRKVFFKIKYIVFSKPKFKQELLIRKALKEKGFKLKGLEIICDHILGFNYVNGIKLGIKYPDSFYYNAINLIPKNKPYDFYFNGNMNESGNRALLLRPFKDRSNSMIISSNDGRIQNKKDQFNNLYFSELAKAKFGLCPHQADWTGDKQYMWTYRFIECCFVNAIPIIFKEAPLGEKFIENFHYECENDFIEKIEVSVQNYSIAYAQENQLLAKQRFCLTDEECKLIKYSLKIKL